MVTTMGQQWYMYNTAQSNNFQMQKRTLHHGMHKANICVTSASVAGRGEVEMCFVQWVTVYYPGLRKSILLGWSCKIPHSKDFHTSDTLERI